MSDKVRLVIEDDGTGIITLDDPKNKNALSDPVIEQLHKAVHECEYNDKIKIVILRGENGALSAGGDIGSLKAKIDANAFEREHLGLLCDIARGLKDMSKPTMSIADGIVAGAGISLCTVCDISIVTETSTFASGFTGLGLVPDAGGTELIIKNAGVARAKEIFMTGRVFSGKEAADWNIVTMAVPKEQFEETVAKMRKKLLSLSPTSFRKIKTMINRVAYPDFDQTLLVEGEYQYASMFTEDHKEGVNAFLEKRKANFPGK